MPWLGADDHSFFEECSDFLLASHHDDEVGFVLGWMMEQFPYCCGDRPEAEWQARGKRLWSEHAASGRVPDPSVFTGRGAFGECFAHIANAKGTR
jgi:hypothetical protein